ncbi:MAG: helix-turn-helix transcriptional regulator [Clostridia bacterium]|nr:helix-turn-helix transcriptional regulator [Clostridia bacterium]
MRLKRNNTSVKHQLLKTYFIVWSIPFLISVILSVFVTADLHSTVVSSNETFLRMIRSEIDDDLESQCVLYTQIALNKDIISLQRNKLSDAERRQLVMKMSSQIDNMALLNNATDNIILFFHDIDIALSGNGITDCKMMYRINFGNGNYEEWRDEVIKCQQGEFVISDFLATQVAEKRIMYIRSLPTNVHTGNNKVTAVVVMKGSFFDTVDTVLRKEGKMVSVSDGKQELPLQIQINENKDKKMTVSSINSEVTGWQYLVYTPENEYWGMLYLAYFGITVIVLLTLAAGIFLIYRATEKSYSPIKDLVEIVKKNQVMGAEGTDEFEYLSLAMENILKSEQRNLTRIEQQDSELRRNFLEKAVKSGTVSSESEFKRLNPDIDIENGSFAVVLFKITEVGELFKEDDISNEERYQLSRVITENIMEEFIARHYKCHFFDVEDFKAAIVNMTEDVSDMKFLSSSLDDGMVAIEENFDFDIKCAVSNINKGINGIHLGYTEAKEVIGHMDLFDVKGLELYRDVACQSAERYHYPQMLESRLVNYITSGNVELSKETLKEIFASNRELSRNELSCVIFGLAGTFVKILSEKRELSSENYTMLVNEINSLLDNDSNIGTKETALLEIAEKLCLWNNEEIQTGGQVVNLIKEYVDKHYQDANLSIQMIGENIGITGYYASKQFKIYTGERLMDYIYRIRVEKAKELILNTDYKLKDIAVKVGLNDTRSLNIMFKRIEGIAPSTYKTVSKNNKD